MIPLQKLDWRAKLLVLWVVLFSLILSLTLPVHIVAAQDVCQCVTCGQIPIPGTSQWSSQAEMCAAGELLPDIPPALIPPLNLESLPLAEQNAYGLIVRKFLEDRKYHEWIPDAHLRFTGNIKGCPADGIVSFGTHALVRIWYSKPVIKWMCSGRQGELPDGAMIVKEEWFIDDPNRVIIDLSTYDPATGTYTMGAPQNLTDAPFVDPMIKRKSNSYDGWYWFVVDFTSPPGDPPLVERSAFVSNPPVNPTQPDPAWYPTGLNGVQSNVVPSSYSFSNTGCTNCHSMSVSEATFSAIENIMGNELVFNWGPGVAVTGCRILDGEDHPSPPPPGMSCPNPFPSPLADSNPKFIETFPELGPVSFQQTYQQRFPAVTYDSVVVGANGPEQFITMDQCLGCHIANQLNNDFGDSGQLWNMILAPGPEFNSPQYALAPDNEWSWSPMGLGGRDAVFLAQLESELNIADRQPDLAPREACIQTLCLSCHGSAGQRQLAIDTAGQGPPYALCNPLLPPNLRGDPTKNGPLPFTRDLLAVWKGSTGVDPADFKYGALGREGITCTICHHTTDQGLGTSESFTGNLKFGPANEVYGPFSNPKQVPMQQAIDTTPLEAPWVKESGICGSCHAIYLPVANNQGEVIKFDYEQTTYFEWLNSDYAYGPNSQESASGPKPCQYCHMPTTFYRDGQSTELAFKIANIADNTLPPYPFLLPLPDITLPVRSNFSRHVFYGLNVPLNAYAQQFPLLMGVSQLDSLPPSPQIEVPLLITRDTVLDIASLSTADVTVDSLERTCKGLRAAVTVKNKTGHFFPSGVDFRRAFIEFRVLDAEGKTLWVSGSTNSVGVILDGKTGQPLDTEFLLPKKPGREPQYQKHYEVVKRQNQVQIYEDLIKDSDGNFTTSFLHRVTGVKDNRLRAVGWRSNGPYAEETMPEGNARFDRDYIESPNQGIDQLIYDVQLPLYQRHKVHHVEVKLFYQSTPPSYLRQRFELASAGPRSQDTDFLYYMTSHLDTNAPDRFGMPYLKDWKLQVGATQVKEISSKKPGGTSFWNLPEKLTRFRFW